MKYSNKGIHFFKSFALIKVLLLLFACAMQNNGMYVCTLYIMLHTATHIMLHKAYVHTVCEYCTY